VVRLTEVVNVCFGYLADPFDDFSLMSAFEGKAAINSAMNHDIEGPESAKGGHCHSDFQYLLPTVSAHPLL
jgi:hypothetical protein